MLYFFRYKSITGAIHDNRVPVIMICLQVLCSGTPTPSHLRWGSSFVLKMDDSKWFMFDCGPAATYKLVQAGISPLDVSDLFFTHHHSDHNSDYACLLLSRFDMSIGNESPLKVYGPPPTVSLTEKLIAEDQGAYWHDIVARTNHPLSLWAYQQRGGVLPRAVPVVDSKDISPGVVLSNDDVVIEAARVEHVQPYLDSLAYRVNYNQGSIVFSGDTRPCQSLIDLAKNADVLVMECIRLHKDMKDNITSECESSAQAAGEVANSAGVKMLVLTHQSPDLDQPFKKEQVIKEVQKSYDGQIEWAVELEQICYEC